MKPVAWVRLPVLSRVVALMSAFLYRLKGKGLAMEGLGCWRHIMIRSKEIASGFSSESGASWRCEDSKLGTRRIERSEPAGVGCCGRSEQDSARSNGSCSAPVIVYGGDLTVMVRSHCSCQ